MPRDRLTVEFGQNSEPALTYEREEKFMKIICTVACAACVFLIACGPSVQVETEPDEAFFAFRTGKVPACRVFIKSDDDDLFEEWLADISRKWAQRGQLALNDAATRRLYEELAPVYAKSDLPLLLL